MTIKLSTLVRDRDTEFTTLNFLQANNNLSDIGSASDSLVNLGLTATAAELNYTDGVTSNLQTQLDLKIDETAADGSAVIPSVNTAARDGSPSAGYLRFNSELVSFEGYDGSAWGAIGGGGGALAAQTAQTTSTSQTAIATWDAATYGSVKAFVQAKSAGERYITEIVITHDGTTAVATEYGQVATDVALASYDVDISGGNVRILATAASTTTTDYIVQAIAFEE